MLHLRTHFTPVVPSPYNSLDSAGAAGAVYGVVVLGRSVLVPPCITQPSDHAGLGGPSLSHAAWVEQGRENQGGSRGKELPPRLHPQTGSPFFDKDVTNDAHMQPMALDVQFDIISVQVGC